MRKLRQTPRSPTWRLHSQGLKLGRSTPICSDHSPLQPLDCLLIAPPLKARLQALGADASGSLVMIIWNLVTWADAGWECVLLREELPSPGFQSWRPYQEAPICPLPKLSWGFLATTAQCPSLSPPFSTTQGSWSFSCCREPRTKSR